MPEPYNYMLGGNLPDPAKAVLSGIGTGIKLYDTLAEANLNRQKLRTAILEQQQQQQMQTELGELSKNPTTDALVKMMIKYPKLSEHFKSTYGVLSGEQQRNKLNQASQVYAALEAGKNDTAMQTLEEQAAAYRNSGLDNDAKVLDDLRELIKASPETAKTSTGLFLASAMGPDKFAETFTKLGAERRAAGLAPSELKKAEADAEKAAVGAKFAESEAVANLQKAGWDIKKIQNDIEISKINARIAAGNLALSRETNALKREELGLKIQEMRDKRDEVVRDRVASAAEARGTIDNILSTAQMVMNTPKDVVGAAAGPVSAKTPTLRQATADFEELINTMKSQTFLAQVNRMKNLGTLSDAEGAKLEKGLASLELRQSPERLMSNVAEIHRLMTKARERLVIKYGVPDTPVNLRPGAGPRTVEVDY